MATNQVPEQFTPPTFDEALYRVIVPLPRKTNLPTPGAVAERIPYYSFVGTPPDGRGIILASMLVWAKTANFDSSLTSSWVWSMIDCAFPGLAQTMLTVENLAVGEPQLWTEHQYRWLVKNEDTEVVGIPATDTTAGRATIPAGAATFDLLPELCSSALTREADVDEAIGALAILLFGIGKQATTQNITAFTVNRPRAFGGKGGVEITPASPIHASNFPPVSAINRFSGHFGVRTKLRITFTTLLVDWTLTAGSPHQEIVATQVGLWVGTGLTHMEIVRSFMASYSRVVARIPGLLPEVLEFERVYREFGLSSDSRKYFTKVIHKDRAMLGDGRKYKGLQTLARQMLARVDPRYNNYAVNLGNSVWWDEFERVARDLGYALPSGGGQFAEVATG